MLSSARMIGGLLLAVPIVAFLAGSRFPSYDARSRYFAGTYRAIVEAGDAYLVALVLFLVMATILAVLALAMSRSPLLEASSFLMVVIGGVAASAVGFAIAAVTGLPVWWWARQVTDGSLSAAEAASRSTGLAGISQTALLMLGFGGLLIGMSTLGLIAITQRWVPRWLFWGTVVVVGVAVALALATDGPAIWIGLGLLPMLWAFVFGLVLLIRGSLGLEERTAKPA
ncbi:MAG: hypothetical protein O6705_10335 [Actinobacteria bacterium]|nr:hypothetical protein [Actinomycetota bacterium]